MLITGGTLITMATPGKGGTPQTVIPEATLRECVKWATCYRVHKQATGDPRTLPAGQVVKMLWEHIARIGRTCFPNLGPRFGQSAVGAPADRILIDHDPPTPVTDDNWPWHIVFGLDGTRVDTTIVAGRMLMQRRKLLTLDEGAIMAHARELAGKLWPRI